MCISELFANFNIGSVIAIILGMICSNFMLAACEAVFGKVWGNILYPIIWLAVAIYLVITIPIRWC